MNIPHTVNSRLTDTPLLRTLAITDKTQIPFCRGLTKNDSRYYGLSLFRTQNDVPKVSAITRVDCNSLQSASRKVSIEPFNSRFAGAEKVGRVQNARFNNRNTASTSRNNLPHALAVVKFTFPLITYFSTREICLYSLYCKEAFTRITSLLE